MADPWGREGSDRAKMPVELGPHLQAGAWQSQGTGTQGQGSSLLAPSLSQNQRSELGIVKAHWVLFFVFFWFFVFLFFFCLFLVHFPLVSKQIAFGTFQPTSEVIGDKAWELPPTPGARIVSRNGLIPGARSSVGSESPSGGAARGPLQPARQQV